jgi:ribonuclease P protein component
MLKAQNRLVSKRDFLKVSRESGGARSRYFSGKALKSKLEISRFGFVISLQVSKKSTVRNLLKRRMREVIMENLPNLRQGYDVVIRAKPEAIGKDFGELKEDLGYLLRSLNLCR